MRGLLFLLVLHFAGCGHVTPATRLVVASSGLQAGSGGLRLSLAGGTMTYCGVTTSGSAAEAAVVRRFGAECRERLGVLEYGDPRARCVRAVRVVDVTAEGFLLDCAFAVPATCQRPVLIL